MRQRGCDVRAIAKGAISALALAISLAAPGLAAAASVLDAPYGDKEGCRYAETGESSGSDAFFLLTDTEVTTSTSVCAFAGPLTATKSGFQTRATCESEGESGEAGTVEIIKSAKGYTVVFDDGTRYGPLRKCRAPIR